MENKSILLSVLFVCCLFTSIFAISLKEDPSRFIKYADSERYIAYMDKSSFVEPRKPADGFSCLQIDTYAYDKVKDVKFGQTKRFFFDHQTGKIYLQYITLTQYDNKWNVISTRHIPTDSSENMLPAPFGSILYKEALQAYNLYHNIN